MNFTSYNAQKFCFPLRKNNPQCAPKFCVKDAEMRLPFVFETHAKVLLKVFFLLQYLDEFCSSENSLTFYVDVCGATRL